MQSLMPAAETDPEALVVAFLLTIPVYYLWTKYERRLKRWYRSRNQDEQ